MFLLDTNVISELRKVRRGSADRKVSAWADRVNAARGLLLRAWMMDCVLPSSAEQVEHWLMIRVHLKAMPYRRCCAKAKTRLI